MAENLQTFDRWHDMAMNLFWLGVGGGSLILIHLATLLFLRWRLGTQARGILEFPGLELFLLILMLPCISQSSAFVIRGERSLTPPVCFQLKVKSSVYHIDCHIREGYKMLGMLYKYPSPYTG